MLVAFLAAAPSNAATPYEKAVLIALNGARADPARYVERLRRYRGYFRGGVVLFPGSRVRHRTSEGVRPVDDAIAFMTTAPTRAALSASLLLEQAASDHVREQGETGAVGHGDRANRMPQDRVQARGGRGAVAEVIEYGASDPEDVVMQLIVDDGVPDRGHRAVLFADQIHVAGVSCGPHPLYRTMCVIDFAGWMDDATRSAPTAIARIEDSDFGRSMSRLVDRLVLRERLRRARHRVGAFVRSRRRHGE